MTYVVRPDEAPRSRHEPHGDYTHFLVRAVPMMTHVALRGGCHTEAHMHSKEVQTYYILEGSGQIVIDGEGFAVQTGDAVIIPPGKDHHMENPNDGQLRFLMQYLLEGDAEYPIYHN